MSTQASMPILFKQSSISVRVLDLGGPRSPDKDASIVTFDKMHIRTFKLCCGCVAGELP